MPPTFIYPNAFLSHGSDLELTSHDRASHACAGRSSSHHAEATPYKRSLLCFAACYGFFSRFFKADAYLVPSSFQIRLPCAAPHHAGVLSSPAW